MKTDVMEAPVQASETPAASSAVARRESSVPAIHTDAEGNVSPTQLIALAIERGISPESLEKLVELQHRMEERNAVKAFIRDLAALKAKLPTILHSKKADFNTRNGGRVSYSYTEMDELAAVVYPFLSEFGFTTGWDQKFDGKLVTTTCTLQHIEGHSRHSSFTLPAENDSAASAQQKIGMADTYAGRRAFLAVLGLTTSDRDPRPAEIDPTPISDEQAKEIDRLLVARNAGKAPADAEKFSARFLKHMEAESIAKIRAVDFNKAVTALQPVASTQKKGGE